MKKRRFWVKLFSLTLVLLMIASSLVACKNQGEDKATAETKTKEEGVATDENGIPLDALPENLNFDRTFKILGNEARKHQFWVEDENSVKNIDKVIYNRNLTVSERMGVEFEWTFMPGEKNAEVATFIEKIRTTSSTGDPFDGVIAYNLVPQIVASQGLAANLYNSEHIDLTAPWWPQVYLREMIVNDQLYCLVESGSYGLLNHMMAMYFNNELLDARSLESPYDLVKNNEWTVAKLKEMIKDTYEDADYNERVSGGDIYGYCTGTQSKMDCWFFALGNQFSKVENGEVVSLLNGEHIGTFVDTMVDFFSTDDAYHSDSSQFKMFVENRAYFYCSSVMLSEKLAEVTDQTYNYGVVPMPKMDSSQELYYTHVANCHDVWCVPYNARDMKCVSAVMECMASEAYRQINPTYYDVYVKLRYAPDERLAEMYDLVRDSVTFDFTYLFSRVFTANPGNLVKNCFLSPEKYVWSTVYAENANSMNASFEEIVKTFASK